MSEELRMVMLVLPFPVSVNEIWRGNGSRTFTSPTYKTWKQEANAAFLQQKRAAGTPITGHFTYHVVLDEKRRTPKMDGDNYASKAVLDFLQSVNVIENDSKADAGSWSWGPCDPGMCIVSVFQRGMQPVNRTRESAS